MLELNNFKKNLLEKCFYITLNSRMGIIPNADLSNKEYKQALINSILKIIAYYKELINKTNKKTKKYNNYIDFYNKLQNTLKDIQNMKEN